MIDSDGILGLSRIPGSLVVVGAGVIGIEHADDHTILGVHIFDSGATELVHIGQTVMALGGTVDFLVDSVFNYPTLAESYKVAALDASNKLNHLTRVTA